MLNESELRIGKFIKDSDPAKSRLAKLYIEASKAWRTLYGYESFPTQQSLVLERSAPTAEKPQVDLTKEWTRQAEQLADLFAKELGQSKDEYLDKLPKFSPQPEQFKGRFDTPVLVETRLPLKKTLEIAGITYYIDPKEVKDWDTKRLSTPKIPYATWLEDGTRNLNKSVSTVRQSLAVDERGGTVQDGIALYLKDPAILKDHYLDFPGSLVGSDSAPSLYLWDGRPRLGYVWVALASPRYGSVVAGKL